MKNLAIFLLALLCISFSNAQQPEAPGAIASEIARLQDAGTLFQPFQAIQAVAAPASAQKMSDGIVFSQTSDSEITRLRQAQPNAITFELPAEIAGSNELILFAASPFTPDFIVRTSDNNGVIAGLDYGLHYRGILENDPFSIAAISLTSEGVSGMISTDAGTWELLPDARYGKNSHIFRKVEGTQPLNCGTQNDGRIYTDEELNFTQSSQKAGDCVRIYVEADKDIYASKGSLQNTINWVTGLFNQYVTLFGNENINTAVSEIFVWTSNSPYKGQNASNLLSAFQSTRPSINGDLGIMVNLKNAGGIAAGFDGLCNSSTAQKLCYGGITSSYANFPSYSWSVSMICHELGHLYGSRHTHACVWNGNGTAIDGCSGFTEGSCPLPGLPSNGGTIMSYCDNTSAGVNFSLGFGSQPGNVIRSRVSGANCLSASCGGSTGSSCTNGIQDGNETGVDCGGSCPPCNSGGQCDAPSGLFASNISRNRAKLNWSAATGANDYTVEVRSIGSSSWSSSTTSGTNITFRGLSNGTDYEWRVTANCSGADALSATCSFTAGNSNSGACGNMLSRTNDLRVFPNPASDLITVELPASDRENFEIAILDVMGRVLWQSHASASSRQAVDISQFSAGVYWLRADDGSGALQPVRIVVQ